MGNILEKLFGPTKVASSPEKIDLPDCLSGLDTCNIKITDKFLSDLERYDFQYKSYVEDLKKKPVSFNTKNLQCCFKYHWDWRINNDQEDYFYIGYLYNYYKVSAITKKNIVN